MITTIAPSSAGSTWIPGASPGYTIGIAQFIKMYPNSGFSCPSKCPGCLSSSSPQPYRPPLPPTPITPPPPAPPPPQPPAAALPITQPPQDVQPPPPAQSIPSKPITQDPCGPAMAQRTQAAIPGGGEFSTSDHLMMTGGGAFMGGRLGTPPEGVSLATWMSSEPSLTGKPQYSRIPRVRVEGDWKTGLITVYEPAAGPGWTAFHSPDLNEFCMRGDGVHAEGRWPRRISSQTLIIHSGSRNDPAEGDDSDQRLGWGLPSARTVNPRSGWYARRSSTNSLEWKPTDADGEDSATRSERFEVGGVLETTSGRVIVPVYVTADTTLDASADLAVVTGAHDLTMQPSPRDGARCIVKNSHSAAIDVIPNTGQTIDGSGSNYALPAGAAIVLAYDGSGSNDWMIVSSHAATGSSLTFPIQAPDDGVPNYSFDGSGTPGSENSGMGFQPGTEGPTLFDVAGNAQLTVRTTGVDIPGKLNVVGGIDPTYVSYTPQASRPSELTTLGNGSWVDNTAERRMRYFDGTTDHVATSGPASSVDKSIPMFSGTAGDKISQGRFEFGTSGVGAGTDENSETVRPIADPSKGVAAIVSGRDATTGNNDGGGVHLRTGAPAGSGSRGKVSFQDGAGTVLSIETIADGQFMKRQGSQIVGAAGGGSLAVTEVEVDFGTDPVYDARFTVVDAAISGTSKILISESGKAATGRAPGDSEWDSISATALPGSGQMTVMCKANPGPVAGRRILQYTVN